MNVLKANNPWPRGAFAAEAPGLDWRAFFEAAGLAAQPAFIVWHPGAVRGEAALVASEPLDDWRLYLRYSVLNEWSELLPQAFADEAFAFFGTTLSGTPKQSARWKRGVDAAERMGDAVGTLYAQRHFPPESKRAVEAMVADITRAFATRIDTLGNAMRASEYEYRYRVSKLTKAIDRGEWWMTPQTVNAVNLPIQNALNFPAALLQPPYFDPKSNAAGNYGMVGATIGHEISHSFDDQGAQFDATGKLSNWWTADGHAPSQYRAQTVRNVDEWYPAFKVQPGAALFLPPQKQVTIW